MGDSPRGSVKVAESRSATCPGQKRHFIDMEVARLRGKEAACHARIEFNAHDGVLEYANGIGGTEDGWTRTRVLVVGA